MVSPFLGRLFARPRSVEPSVSASERELWGGPLRYDLGWSTHEYARLELTLMSALRSVPQMVRGTLRLALGADRRAMITVAVTEVGQGVTAALGLIVVNTVLGALLAGGTTAERLTAALPALLAGCAIAVAGAVLASLSTAAAGRLEPKVERAANERFLAGAAGVELEAIEDGEFRRLIDIAQFGATAARSMIGVCVAAVNGIISLLAAGGVLTVLHPALLPMLLLIAAPRGWGAMRVAQRRYVSTMQWVEHVRAGRVLGNLLTSRSAAQEVRVHGVGGFFLGHYRAMAQSAEAEQSRLAKDKAATELLAAGLSGLAAVATYAALAWLILTGHMDLAVAGTAVVAVRAGSAALGALVMNLNTLHEESLYVRDLERFVEEAARRAIPATGLPLGERVRAVSFEKVSYGYPDRERPAVDGVTLTFPVGRVTALVGENGAGKSTLIKMLAGLLLPDDGRILWDGVELREADRTQVFAQVGLLTQDFERWPMTAGTNIRISDTARPADETAMAASARYAGAERMIAELPHGMDTLLARMFRGASELSGGQWQKLGLARAHYRDARVLIVDEPTSALDPAAEVAAFAKIRALAGPERAVVLVTHRMAAVQQADHIYVLHEGRLAEQGTHDALLARGGRYASMYRLQADQYAAGQPPAVPRPARGAAEGTAR
ncbi:multidrug ABC transporter permease [Streptomyces purpureus]|uniref:Multidrug ABC transporter permease n=1 Tax=Streptomyces purpureus TaxID=1951 RepID=A0A918H2M9_9ACTN|nr:ABC transporter ATP-binding protein [Streptomyces purpureus]GGT29687.1 multidrug ABC transporter permease [Streptomyces purpureus]